MISAESAAKVRGLWRTAPRRWGHPLHSLCSYMAMFPPSMPRVFIDWLTEEGDAVYDPFSGRGTTALEACASGRIGMGSDLNPLAHVLTSAKVTPPSWDEVELRLSDLRVSIAPADTSNEPEAIKAIFSEMTLAQLVWLRDHLDTERRADAFLLATLLGILHLNADSAGRPKGLSVSMPNTFAMAPNYVMNYVKGHRLVAPEVDVLDALRTRAERYKHHLTLPREGHAWMQDASKEGLLEQSPEAQRPKLVFSSPPYLHVIKYAKFNWIRLWLLGEKPADVDADLFTTGSLTKYLDFMSTVLGRLAGAVREDGYICMVIGDVTDGESTTHLANYVARECMPESLKLRALIADEIPRDSKVSRIWGETKGKATKTDRILVLAAPEAPRIPPVPTLKWA